ncbi:unnamed protein product [Symbiodinium natans]|uniref:Uncharacterized protein n=1 Tax=Symbiodinium natans TaxID=878477 RepID=A0A812LHT4_9DINO|nr:unnamed protein product [Symbiodinium natans]
MAAMWSWSTEEAREHVPHPLLSCSRTPFWNQFRSELTACTLPRRGGRVHFASAAKAFGQALYFTRAFLPQVTRLFQQQAVFFVLCERYEEVAARRTDWASFAPISNFEQEVQRMISMPHAEAPPCLFGWTAALLCELRVEQAVLSGAWPELDAELEELLASEGSEDLELEEEKRQVLLALLARDAAAVARLTTRGRWALRGLLRGGHRALSLLESSGWCSLEDVLEALPDGELGPVLDSHAVARAQSFLNQVLTMMPRGDVQGAEGGKPGESTAFVTGRRSQFRVWATSTHATLLLEPLSIWTNLLELGHLEATLCVNGCVDTHLHGVTCVDGGLVNQLLQRHLSTVEDSLGRFPLVPSLEHFRRDFDDMLVAATHSELHRADVLLCGEPAFICALLAELNKTVVGYVGNPLGAYLTADDQKKFYSFVAQVPQFTSSKGASLHLVFMAPPIAAQGYWQTGVRMPVVRPVARYASVAGPSAPSQPAPSQDVLITKQVFTFWDFQCLLNSALSSWGMPPKWSFRYMTHLKDRSWRAWASYRAAVVLPYDPQTLVFYELYSMAVPLLVPSKALLPLFFARSYGQDASVAIQRQGWRLRRSGSAWGRWHEEATYNELRWWALLSDIAQLPHLLAWSSLAELLALLTSPASGRTLADTSKAMAEVTKQNCWRSMSFWKATLAENLFAGAS